MDKKELIISLIKDNLRNTHLLMGLSKLGFDTDKNHLYLSDTIFKLFRFKGDEYEEKVFEKYLIVSMKIASIDIFAHPEKLEIKANKIYRYLVKKKKLQKKHNKRQE